jgi:hypothetical protein
MFRARISLAIPRRIGVEWKYQLDFLILQDDFAYVDCGDKNIPINDQGFHLIQ